MMQEDVIHYAYKTLGFLALASVAVTIGMIVYFTTTQELCREGSYECDSDAAIYEQ